MADAQVVDVATWGPVSRRDATARIERDPDGLYRELAPAVLGYLRAQGASDPEDLLMDVFVAVVRDLDGVRGDADAVRRWVFTIAHHRIVDERRHRSRRTRLRSADVAEFDRPVPDAMSEGTDPELVSALADRLS